MKGDTRQTFNQHRTRVIVIAVDKKNKTKQNKKQVRVKIYLLNSSLTRTSYRGRGSASVVSRRPIVGRWSLVVTTSVSIYLHVEPLLACLLRLPPHNFDPQRGRMSPSHSYYKSIWVQMWCLFSIVQVTRRRTVLCDVQHVCRSKSPP